MNEKNSFIAYHEWAEYIEELPDEMQLKLFKAMFRYAKTHEFPEELSVVEKAIFAGIKSTIDRDFEKWRKSVEKKREAARRTNEKRWGKSDESESLSVAKRQKKSLSDKSDIASVAPVAVNVNDNVNVNVNDNDNDDVDESTSIARVFTHDTAVNVADIVLTLRNEGQAWKETVAMQLHLKSVEDLEPLFLHFQNELIAQGVEKKGARDLKTHFLNMSRKYLQNEIKRRNNKSGSDEKQQRLEDVARHVTALLDNGNPTKIRHG